MMQSVSRSNAINSLDLQQQVLAQKVVDQVFDSLRWTHVQEGIVQDWISPAEWKHRTEKDVESDLAYLEIDRVGILQSLSEYVSNDAIRTREIDWVFLNLLTYAEYLATVAEIRKSVLGVDEFIKTLHPPKVEHLPSVSQLTMQPWKAAFAVVVTLFAFLIHPLLALGIGAVAMAQYCVRKKRADKVDAVLASMFHTYASFNTLDLSWSHVTRVLEDSRRHGVIWDAALFRLAEIRNLTA